jgi:hypothetical protein
MGRSWRVLPSLSGPRSSTMTSHLLHHLIVGPTFLQAAMPADGVPPEGSLLYELGARPAQDGVWAGAGGCFLIRGVQSPHELARAAKEVERTHPNPVPEGTSPAASDRAADSDIRTTTTQFSVGSPRPSSTFYAARRPACAPARLWPCLGPDASPSVRPTTLGHTSRDCGGSARSQPDTELVAPQHRRHG